MSNWQDSLLIHIYINSGQLTSYKQKIEQYSHCTKMIRKLYIKQDGVGLVGAYISGNIGLKLKELIKITLGEGSIHLKIS